MAAGSLLTLLDDIASLLDDVSILTKKAAAKTAGVLGDDLALNAEQVSGVIAKRELPVVWAVAKGSFINKLILVPLALLLSAFLPKAIPWLLMVGGLYLCFEGVEKLHHAIQHRKEAKSAEEADRKLSELAATDPQEKVESESDKIKGAVRTDFVLSAEIIAITLGVVESETLARQAMSLSAIAIIMTIGVYGLVAGIVKLDDLGLYLSRRSGSFPKSVGRAILWGAPFLMKLLSILGTAAMFLVGGGIVVHGISWLHHQVEHIAAATQPVSGIVGALLNGVCGLVAGILVLLLVNGIRKVAGKKSHA